MNNDFFNGSDNNHNENSQNKYSCNGYQDYNNNNSFFDSNYQSPYINDNNSFDTSFDSRFDSSAYNGYAGNNSYGQNQSNTYGNYSQNSNYRNNQFDYNNTDFNNGYNQNNRYVDNRYAGDSSYQNNSYGNSYHNQYDYNSNDESKKYYNYLDSSDPTGAEVIFNDENKKSKINNIFLIAFLLVFFSIPSLSSFFNNDTMTKIVSVLMPVLLVGFVAFVGISALIKPSITSFKKKRRCKQPITAKIVDVRIVRGSKGSKSYYPTYKYHYAGKIYIVAASTSRTMFRPQIGYDVQMLINSDDPADYYIESKLTDIVSLIFGIMVSLIPLGMIITIIMTLLFYT